MKLNVPLLFCLIWVSLDKASYAETLTIAAAADLRYAMPEIVAAFERDYPDYSVQVIYGSSGKMTTQIRNGAPYDLFFSADIAFPQLLFDEGHAVAPPTRYGLGRIVIWSGLHDVTDWTLDRLMASDMRRVAIAQPSHAPYGKRAQEALESLGLWDAMQPKLVYGENIAQAAQMVASRAAEVGILALALFPPDGTRRYQLIDEELHEPLEQGFIITTRGDRQPAAHRLAEFMAGEEAQLILKRYGFLP